MAFISLESYKTYANITSSDNDRRLDQLINTVEAFIKRYTGLDFERQEYTEFADVTGAYVELDQLPVHAVLEVSYFDAVGDLQEIEAEEYRVYPEEGLLELTDAALSDIATSRFHGNQLKVRYEAGYLSVPEEIKQVTRDLVKYYDKGEYAPQSVEVQSIDYGIIQDIALPPHIRRILALYRKMV